MITSRLVRRLGAAVVLAPSFLAPLAHADIAQIIGSVDVSARSNAERGGITVNADDQWRTDVNARANNVVPFSADFDYAHDIMTDTARATQGGAAVLSFDRSALAFDLRSSGLVSAGPDSMNQSVRAQSDLSADFSLRAGQDTVLDILIGIVYEPGDAPSESVYAFIGIDGIPNQPGFQFEITNTDEPFEAQLSIRTTLGAGEFVSVNAETRFEMQSFGGDQGMGDLSDVGHLRAFAQVAIAPSPSTAALLGLAGIVAARRRR